MQCFGLRGVHVVALPNELLAGHIRVTADASVTGPLASTLNFARFYLPQLLPASAGRRVLYLDADIVVNHGDLAELHATPLPERVAVAAVRRNEPHFRYARYAKKCAELYRQRYPTVVGGLNASAPTFNAGVALVDLHAWQRLNLTAEAEWWMEQHRRSPAEGGLWALGSQPVMHLVLHGRWARLPEDWNLDGLGRVPNLPQATLDAAHLLHWTGRKKPWLRDGMYTRLFTRHVSREESRRCASSVG